MKIYTVTFDAATLSPARIWVAPYSQFAVGVKVFVRGIEAEGAVSLRKDGQAVPADASKVGGFTVFQAKSAGPGSDEYEVSVDGLQQKMTLVQVTTGSTVFDVGGSVSGGGDMSDYYTKEQTDQMLSAKADEADLTAYATTDSLTAYATADSLTAFYEKSETSSAAEIGTALEGKQPSGNYLTEETEPAFAAVSADLVVDGDLTAYYTKSETSSAAELADAFAGAGGGGAIDVYDVSDSPIQSETLIRQALVDNTCLPQTIALNRDGTIEVFDVEGTLDLHQESPLASLIPNAVKVLVGTKVTNLAGRCFLWANNCQEIVFPNSLSGIAVGSGTGEVFSNVYKLKRIQLPDSLSAFGNVNAFWNWQTGGGGVIDFGNTRTTIPTGGSFNTNVATTKYLVPDDLYETWRQTGNWTAVSAQVFPHSQMPGAVKGSAYAGAIGTPAAIANMQTVYETDWLTLSASALSSTFYVVVPDPE